MQFVYYTILILFFAIEVQANVYCLNSFNREPATVMQCSSNYCKKYTGATGITQLSCDDTGDCQRSFERPFYTQPMKLYACLSDQTTRETCCCNYDFCNASTHIISSHNLFTSSILISILFIII
ncbi:unnamed protein product [Caenorhabditis angaria]|uniref:Activin types I and II receptor domain-containing protein n=1 Tax=Caenorhabditis angaria TaxID=860376 RepID=A0A9P1IZS5_9PELO|nr:unnamed protein product [Caenorhabditis angaria]